MILSALVVTIVMMMTMMGSSSVVVLVDGSSFIISSPRTFASRRRRSNTEVQESSSSNNNDRERQALFPVLRSSLPQQPPVATTPNINLPAAPNLQGLNAAFLQNLNFTTTALDFQLQQRSLEEVYASARKGLGLQDKHFLESSLFISTPLLAVIASYILYPQQSYWFHQAVNFLANNNWEPVDGGQLQWSILLPALNGVVMTAISLLYANLVSTTGTQLRTRQITIHSSLSQESEGIRNLIQLVQYYPKDWQQTFGYYLKQYTIGLVDESFNLSPSALKTNSQPLSDYRNGLHLLSVSNQIHSNIMERSYEVLAAITNARSARITSLQTRFPALHYVTITALTLAILFVFLLETDRKVLLFLDKFQIRSVWALLVGTVTAIYCIGVDLAYPFIGTYTVPADQLIAGNDELIPLIDATIRRSQALSAFGVDTTVVQQQSPPQQHPQQAALPSTRTATKTNNPTGEAAADGGMAMYDEYIKRSSRSA